MHVINFLEIVEKGNVYTIDNNSTTNIVLFGNCHVSAIGFYLNSMFNKKYNIHIIISYISKRKESISEEGIKKILDTVRSADYLIYQKHEHDYNIDASIIDTYAEKNKLLIPNLQLYFTDLYGQETDLDELKKNFDFSYDKSIKNIEQSDFDNFLFIMENYKNIRFFDIPMHPTHYLLYLLSLQIYYKINNIDRKITLEDYYKHKNDAIFLEEESIKLGGVYEYRQSECDLLGININSEHYDPPIKY
jgi:hypothetical protein